MPQSSTATFTNLALSKCASVGHHLVRSWHRSRRNKKIQELYVYATTRTRTSTKAALIAHTSKASRIVLPGVLNSLNTTHFLLYRKFRSWVIRNLIMAAVQGQDRSSPNEHGKPPPALNTLPSEMRKLIVSHLAPGYDTLRPGCKKDLKSANLTHSCLRAWVPEYMFRDMALKHVLMGLSSHLECFAVDPKNAELLKFVKHINVQVRDSCSAALPY